MEPEYIAVAPGRGAIPPFVTPSTGDLGPERMAFIKEKDSPTGKPLLAVAHEVSGTTTVFEITRKP